MFLKILMKVLKVVYSTVLILIVLFGIYYLYVKHISNKVVIKKGEGLVEQVELYRKLNDSIPNTISDIWPELQSETYDGFYYERVDSQDYIFHYSTIVGEGVSYSSKTQEWINR